MPLELPHAVLELTARLDQLDGERGAAQIHTEVVHEAAHGPQPGQCRRGELPLRRRAAPRDDDPELRELHDRIECEIAQAEECLDLDPIVLPEQVRLEQLDAFDHVDSSLVRQRDSNPSRGSNASCVRICSYNARAAGEFAGGITTLSTTY